MPADTDGSLSSTLRHTTEMLRLPVSRSHPEGDRACSLKWQGASWRQYKTRLTDLICGLAQWHQWLRYVRPTPPTIEEQRQDLIRQAQMKELARLADERWASKPSFLDKPKTQHQTPGIGAEPATTNANSGPVPVSADAPSSSTQAPQPDPTSTPPKTRKEENPWAKADRQAPGGNYQPESWSPTSKR